MFQSIRHLKITSYYTYVDQGLEQITLGDKILIVTKRVSYFDDTCKFQQLVFDTFRETEFSIFSPYKCIGMKIWPCRKKVKGQPRMTIWTNLVDLESPMLYTKI